MFDGFRGVISTFGSIVAVLLIMFVTGIITHKGSTGFTAIGYGIAETLIWVIELLKATFTGLAAAAKKI